MITANEIAALNHIFVSRETKLYHACQFTDFCSYIEVGGIPSRRLLEERGLLFTPFDTDNRDRQNNVWNKVFLNLHDFGGTFALGRAAVPNTFGPVAFVMRSNTFSCATDVAICMRSAGALGFSREDESIILDQVESLFTHPIDAGQPNASYVKYAAQLRDVFPDAREPEISCSINSEFVPLNFVAYILVDPYVINGTPLIQYVRRYLAAQQLSLRVIERNVRVDQRSNLYNELIGLFRVSRGSVVLT